MKFKKPKFKDIVFLILVIVLIIPQTRKPIQVFLNKGLALFSPTILEKEDQGKLISYKWELIDKQGHILNFEDAKGKVTLVNFWATWCPPCIAEMPSLQKLYNDYNGKIEFMFVTDDEFDIINSFLEKHNYTFNIYRPISEYKDIFEVKSIPRTFLIDQKGNIIIDKTGAANWNSEKIRNTIDRLIQIKE